MTHNRARDCPDNNRGGATGYDNEGGGYARGPSSNDRCNRCGNFGHWASEKDSSGKFICQLQPCKKCSSRLCPGSRGEECVVCKAEFPENADVKNALGRALSSELYEKLKALHRARKAAGNVRSVASSTTAPEIGDDDDDSDGDGGGVASARAATGRAAHTTTFRIR